ncbi:hypothetical protein KIN20_004364 [Parelaphostrongylus tenuis]|uniref:C2H2-type domain-containing protein n=1 Tax=Parelaphostrongylus tenuis TaxID=148309 RepID=A0AAD5QJ94_PARTN|nr:hypothetical protein KIN20_004364 [Parelaphostrongylus tenuis]
MDTEVIVLDSDEEDLPHSAAEMNGSALASIAIVNSKPLDLDALGIGSLNVEDGVLNNSENQRYCAMRPEEPRSQDLMSIRTKTNLSISTGETASVSHGTQRPSVRSSYTKFRSESQLQEGYGIDALSLLGNTPATHRSDQLRPNLAQMNSWAQNITSAHTNIPRQVPESRIQNYNFEVSGEKSSELDRQLCPSLKFKCQYPNCRRIVTGNVSFVCHLWAHVATWKEYDPKSSAFAMQGDDDAACLTPCKRNDVDMLSTCPSCTARFHTPYLMQVHYTRCHSRQPQAVNRSTCAICERDVGTVNALRNHLVDHEPNDAPYHCKRCRYRCTVRLHLFDHFIREHKNTSTLMCPFCTFTIVVPSYQRKRPVIRVTEFVHHMTTHESESRLGCDNCALSFSNIADKQKHRREHSAVNPKWTLTRRNPETRTRPRSRLIRHEQKSAYQCNKCVGTSENGSTFRKCIACVTLAYNESVYGKRRLATGTADRCGIDALQCSPHGMRFRCQCGLSTRNGNHMADHFYICRSAFDIIDTDEELVEPNETDEAEDNVEAQLFAVLPRADPVVNSSEKVVERKKKFVEPPLSLFEQQVSSICKPEDMNVAVIFYRKAANNVPLSSIKKFRELRASYDFC